MIGSMIVFIKDLKSSFNTELFYKICTKCSSRGHFLTYQLILLLKINIPYVIRLFYEIGF